MFDRKGNANIARRMYINIAKLIMRPSLMLPLDVELLR